MVTISDSTVGTQRLAVSNAGAIELGASTPTSYLSVGGRQLFDGSYITSGSIPSTGLNRVTGSVSVTSQVETSIYVSTSLAGLGSVSGGLLNSVSEHTIDVAIPDSTPGVTVSLPYSVF